MVHSIYLAYDYPVLGAFWTALWVFLWVMWIIVLFRIIIDVFRDDTMGGWAKAGWLLFILLLPFIGVFVYVLARGRGMGEREMQHARAQKAQLDTYIRDTAAGPGAGSAADDLAKLSEIRARGDLTDEEFARAKEKILR
jgi:uncharacterized membrane protein